MSPCALAAGAELVSLATVGIVLIAIVVVALAGRGRKLKCPDCGTVFAAPAMDNKRSGMGWTLPYTGTVKCPECGQSRGRRDYQKPSAGTSAVT